VTVRLRGVTAAATLTAMVMFTGCGQPTRAASNSAVPRAYHPERFPDIPLPPGYMLAPGHDQLAVAMAGGVVRRFDVWMIAKPKQAGILRAGELLAWYDERLPGLGWTPIAAESGAHRFRRLWPEGVGEELTIAAAGSLAGPTVEFHLAPWSVTAGTPAKP